VEIDDFLSTLDFLVLADFWEENIFKKDLRLYTVFRGFHSLFIIG